MGGEGGAFWAKPASVEEGGGGGVPPMTHAVPTQCPLRGDVAEAQVSTESAMRNAPASEASFFAVPAVFGGGAADDSFDGEG